MAQLRPCPYCKGAHRLKKAYNACKRRNAKAAPWPK